MYYNNHMNNIFTSSHRNPIGNVYKQIMLYSIHYTVRRQKCTSVVHLFGKVATCYNIIIMKNLLRPTMQNK